MKIESYQCTRWALMEKFDDAWRFLGPYCWSANCWLGGHKNQVPTVTFRTRKLARKMQRECCYPRARPVKVRVTVEVIGK